MTIKFQVEIRSDVDQELARIQRQLAQVPREAYDFFVKETPVRSGNARRKTRRTGDTIHANYDYAQRLDQGWSKQAPNGMVEPTQRFIEQRLKKITGK